MPRRRIAGASAVGADGYGARRRRRSKTALVLGGGGLTGGRLRDGRAARARSALGQPDGQRVRRLRRHQRRRVRRRRGGQRGHARGDDAGDRPAGADAVSRRPRQLAAASPTTRSSSPAGVLFPLRLAQVLRTLARDVGQISAVDIVARAGRGAARPGCTRARGSSATCGGSCPIRTAPTTSGCCASELYLSATDLDTCERIVFGAEGLGRRADLQGGGRLERAADDLQAGQGRRPRDRRRRPGLDHQPRHRGRGGRQVHRRRQPAGART